MKPYPAYTDSGLPWLGQIPAHWKVMRLKSSVSSINDQTSEKRSDEHYIALEHVESWTGRISLHEDSAFESQVKRFQPDDVLFGKLRPYLAKVARPNFYGVCVSEFLVLRAQATKITPAYLKEVLQSKPVIDVINSSTFGAKMPRADWGFVGNLIVPFPPLDEQRAIARFLAHHDRLTRRYIRTKQKMIALLNEQKQALIHRAVTRGLDPNVKLKSSGVEWLGEVPEHWEVKRIKYLLREVDERSTSGNETLLSLRMNHGLVAHDEHFTRPGQAATLVGYKKVRPGQVVLNRLQANNGLVFASEVFGLVSPDYAVFNSIADVDLLYLTALFRTPMMKHKFRVESKGLGTGTSGFLRLYTDRFGTIEVPLPPRNEQSQIMGELDVLLKGLHNAIARIEREIALLREYRTRLIADVVTGKVDVRGAAAGLPEEEEESATEDLSGLREAGPAGLEEADIENEVDSAPEEVEI